VQRRGAITQPKLPLTDGAAELPAAFQTSRRVSPDPPALKGTLSEVELHLIRARLDGGPRNKEQSGGLELNLPMGA
jgi:hypothetical protein